MGTLTLLRAVGAETEIGVLLGACLIDKDGGEHGHELNGVGPAELPEQTDVAPARASAIAPTPG